MCIPVHPPTPHPSGSLSVCLSVSLRITVCRNMPGLFWQRSLFCSENSHISGKDKYSFIFAKTLIGCTVAVYCGFVLWLCTVAGNDREVTCTDSGYLKVGSVGISFVFHFIFLLWHMEVNKLNKYIWSPFHSSRYSMSIHWGFGEIT